MPATLRTVTLGCKENQYETEFVWQGLLRAGFRDAAAMRRQFRDVVAEAVRDGRIIASLS